MRETQEEGAPASGIALPGSQLIIVGGAPRSGTTVTQTMLDSHPDIFGGPEFDRLPEIAELRNKFIASILDRRINAFCDIAHVNACFAQLIQSLLLPAMERNKARYISEKTPFNVKVFKDLIEILPAAKFVHVVRDPRGAVASMKAVAGRYRAKGVTPPGFIADIPAACRMVQECVSAGYAASVDFPNHVFTLKYERMVAAAEAEMKALLAFLGIPWDDRVIRPGESKHDDMERLRAEDGGVWDSVGSIANVFSKSVEKWRTILTPEDQQYVTNYFAGSEAHSALGYALAH